MPCQRTFIKIIAFWCLAMLSYSMSAQSRVNKYRHHVGNLMQIGNYSEALRWLDSLIAIDPLEIENYLRKGYINAKLHDYAESNANYTKALQIDPESSGSRFSRANTWLELLKPDSAVLDFTLLIGHGHTTDSLGYRGRAHAYFSLRNFEMAKRDLDSLEKFHPLDRDFFFQRLDTRNELNDWKGALDDIQTLINLGVPEKTFFKNRALIFAALHEWSKCIDESTAYLSKNKPNAPLLFVRGCAFLELKSYYKASDDFEACAKMNFESFDLFRYRGRANFLLAHDVGAIKDLTKVWAKDQSDVSVLFMLGVSKNNVEAGSGCADLRNAIKLGSSDAKRVIQEFCPEEK